VTAGGPQKTTIVHFTNDPVMGTLEICKYAQNGTNASGSFTFSISSPSMDDEDDHAVGWMDNLPAPPDQVVTIGSCSKMIPVPAGTTIIKEHPTNGQLFVTKINVSPEARFISKNIEKGKAVVEIWPNDAEHGETAVEFYNSLGTLKVCKVAWDDAAIALGPYPFYVNGATTPFTLQPNEDGAICHEVGQFAPGALTTVMEGVVPGTAVKWIKLNGFHDGDDGGFITAATDPKAPYLDVVNPDARTVAFYMRPGVNEIVFANDPAASVPLKVCKTAAGTATYSFSTSGLTGFDDPFWGLAPTDRNALKHVALTSFTVPTGQCKFVGYFPYNGTITVQETSGNLTNVAIDPLSTTAMLVGTPNYGARSANVYLGSYATWDQCRYKDLFPAVVNFTNGAALNPTPDSNPNPGPAAPVAQGLTTTPPAEATVVSTTPPTKVVAPAKVLKVASAKIVSVGKLRYVVVRVNGNTKMAHIHVTLIDKNHKVVGKVTRYVTTNKAVRVGNLTLKPSIVSVKVAL
ncbi:MAG TPA: hypothetical protein VI408_02275, partial [Gaiellaceae bacterium]